MNVSSFEENVDEKLRIPMYMKTYALMVHPIPDRRNWPDINKEKLWPPLRHTKADKPRTSKKKDSTKEGKKNRYPYLDTMFVMRWATTRGIEKKLRQCK